MESLASIDGIGFIPLLNGVLDVVTSDREILTGHPAEQFRDFPEVEYENKRL
jgi:hypothetical protein